MSTSPFRSDEEIKPRVDRMNEIREAFKQAGVGTRADSAPAMHYSYVVAYLNLGFGGQRQVVVTIHDDGECCATMSKIYTLPEGKGGDDVNPGELRPLFKLPATTPDLVATIIRRVREEAVADSEMMSAKLRERPAPPVPLSELETVADLIRIHEQYLQVDEYDKALIAVLKKTGKVAYGEDQVWEFDRQLNLLTWSEYSPTSPRALGPDGQRIIHTNAANIRLKPLLPG